MKIGTNIKKLRTAQNLTQDQLAEKLYVTRQTVSSWERSASNPNLEQLEAIAAALGVDVMVLLYGPQPRYRPSRRRVVATLLLMAAVVLATVLGYGTLAPWLSHDGPRFPGRYVVWLFFFAPGMGLLWGLGLGALAALRWRLALTPLARRRCGLGGIAALLVNLLLVAGGRLSWHILEFWSVAHEAVGLLSGLAAGVLLFLAACSPRGR